MRIDLTARQCHLKSWSGLGRLLRSTRADAQSRTCSHHGHSETLGHRRCPSFLYHSARVTLLVRQVPPPRGEAPRARSWAPTRFWSSRVFSHFRQGQGRRCGRKRTSACRRLQCALYLVAHRRIPHTCSFLTMCRAMRSAILSELMGNSLVARIDRCEPCRLREKAPQILEDMNECTSRSALHASDRQTN